MWARRPGAADYDKRTCLHLAASEGNLSIVKCLLNHRVDVNFKDRWGGTALRDAVREGHRHVATLLFDHGGRFGETAEELASELLRKTRASEIEGMRMLLDHGVSADVQDYDGRTALHIACIIGSRAPADVLLAAGASTNIKDVSGATPGEHAKRAGHRDLAEHVEVSKHYADAE